MIDGIRKIDPRSVVGEACSKNTIKHAELQAV